MGEQNELKSRNLHIAAISHKDDGLNDGLKISDRGLKIISAIKENPTINVDNIAKLLGTSKPTAEREIATLKTNGIIERQGSKKCGNWIVKH